MRGQLRPTVQKYFLPAASLLSGNPALSFPTAFTSWFGGGKAGVGWGLRPQELWSRRHICRGVESPPLSGFWWVRKELNDNRGRGCAIVQASLGPGWLISIPGSASGFLHDLGPLTYLFFSLAPKLQHGNPSLPAVPCSLWVSGGAEVLWWEMRGGEAFPLWKI